MDKRKQRIWQLAGVTVVAAAAVAALIIISQSGSGDEKESQTTATTVMNAAEVNKLFAGIPQSKNVVGDSKAPLTVVEYGDLQCPVCAEFSETTLPTIVKKYIRTGKVRMEFKPLTFLDDNFGVDDSKRGANFILAAGDQQKTWQTVDLIYANQGDEGSGYMTDDFLLNIGNAVDGLDAQKALDQSKDDPFTDALDAFKAESQVDGVQGTPSFVIGKTGTQGTLWNYSSFSPEAFSKKLDQELAKVK